MPSVALVHTVPALAERFEELFAELLPSVEVRSVVAEQLLTRTVERGAPDGRTADELRALVEELRADADAVLVTCSTLGRLVDELAGGPGAPVLRVDEAMARRAVRGGRRVGVLATLSTTLEPTAELVERVAREEQREVVVVALRCAGAFEAVSAGDGERHDELVRAGLDELMPQVDVVVLAQASMARAVESLPEQPPVPVLSSPRLAVEDLASRFGQSEAG
jgi:Asp/Glu/hydantoin racemase